MRITVEELEKNFNKYLELVENGSEIIIISNDKEVARLISKNKIDSYMSDSLLGILKKDVSEKDINIERISDNKNFNLFENIELSEEDKEYFKFSDMVNEIIIQLITRRIELKMSQRDLAKISGIKHSMIARIEKFESIPKLDTLVKLANALNLKLTFTDIKK